MDPYLGIGLGVSISLVAGIFFGHFGGDHTLTIAKRVAFQVLFALIAAGAVALFVPEGMGVSGKVALGLICTGIGAALTYGYWILLYLRSLEGEDERMQHQIAARHLGWKFVKRTYTGPHPLNAPGPM